MREDSLAGGDWSSLLEWAVVIRIDSFYNDSDSDSIHALSVTGAFQ